MATRTMRPLLRSTGTPQAITWSVVLLLFGMLTGCSSAVYESRWNEGEIAVDGKGTAWHDSLFVLDDKGTFIGILNDETYLYVDLRSTNRDLERQVVQRGLTFWFDRDGGEQKQFGIHFPLGIDRFGGMRGPGSNGNEAQAFRRRDSIFVPVNDIEILGPGQGEQHRVAIDKSGGVDARFQVSNDTLTYTLKMPISSSGYFPYTVGVRPGTVIGITLESSNAIAAGRPSDGSGEEGGRGGGFGGRGGYGGRGGFDGGGFGGGRPGTSGQEKPFSKYFKVQLANRDQASNN